MLNISAAVKVALFFEKVKMIRYKTKTQRLTKHALVKLP